jgi:hypothetical protein
MERIQNLIATLSDAHDKLEHGIATGFERVGSVVSHRPKLFFILSIIFIIASSCGIALIDVRFAEPHYSDTNFLPGTIPWH